MRIRESQLRRIVSEELAQLNEQGLLIPSLIGQARKMYGDEEQAADLGVMDKTKYSLTRATADVSPSAARSYVTSQRPEDASATFKWDGALPTIANPAVAAATAEFVMPNFINNPIWIVASIFDPTGAMSWPYLVKAWSEYSREKSVVNSLMLLLSLVGCIPLLGSAFRSTRFATTGLKIFQGGVRAESTAGKLGTVVQTFLGSSAKWTELVTEIQKSGALAAALRQIPNFVGKADDVYDGLLAAAKWVDGNNKILKYLGFIFGNAKGSTLTYLVEKMGGRAAAAAPKVAADATAVATRAATAVPGVAAAAADATVMTARAARSALEQEWMSYVTRSSKWGQDAVGKATKIMNYWIERGKSLGDYIQWYSQSRMDPKIMQRFGKAPGQHITFPEVMQLLGIR